jgi:hypothetical protein
VAMGADRGPRLRLLADERLRHRSARGGGGGSDGELDHRHGGRDLERILEPEESTARSHEVEPACVGLLDDDDRSISSDRALEREGESFF